MAILASSLVACSTAHYPINERLTRIDASQGYRAEHAFATEPDDRFFLHVSLSGGGARAAALGLGALEALRDTSIRWQDRNQRLIDQIHILTGVSGGSMLAAWYALHGAEGLPAFERAFFDASLQSTLISLLLTPRSLWRVQSARFGRSDLLAEHLDQRLYRGATFGDLARRGKKPFTVIHSSDMVTGSRFEFVQDQFDFLCSDLDSVPLSRAVAASSAVPLVLSPVTLWNYTPADGDAGCGEPAVLQRARSAGSTAAARLAELDSYRLRLGKGLLRPYVHLLDGGLSDNVGARGPIDYVTQFGGVVQGTRHAGYRAVQRAVFIVVNAETSARDPADRSADVPNSLRTALALADIPINRNSSAALAQARLSLSAWRAEVAEAHRRGDFSVFAADAQFHLIEISIADEPNADERDRLSAIPTNLSLSRHDLQALRAFARRALAQSTDFQALMRDVAVLEAPALPASLP